MTETIQTTERHKVNVSVDAVDLGMGGLSKLTNASLFDMMGHGFSGTVETMDVSLGQGDEPEIIHPPLPLGALEQVVDGCVPLSKCIESKAINVAGRGLSLKPLVDARENIDETIWAQVQDEEPRLSGFFKNISPELTTTTFFKLTMLLLEKFANSYWEVIRGGTGGQRILGMKLIEDPKTMRLCKKDKDPSVIKVRSRVGNKYDFYSYEKSFRRFAQLRKGNEKVYFREFGDLRQMDKRTGKYGDFQSIPMQYRATEIIHFKHHYSGSDYGVPRWIAALVDAISARSAKICNLDILDNSGTPPLAIIVSGSSDKDLDKKIRDQIANIKGKDSRTKALIIQLELEEGGAVGNSEVFQPKIQFEPLSHLITKEGMFLEFLKFVDQEITGIFRIPAILLGDLEDTPNKSTAEVAKQVAEEQVFGPARAELNDFINEKLLCENIVYSPLRSETGVLYWEFALNSLGFDRTESTISVLKEGRAQAALTPGQAQTVIQDLLPGYNLKSFDDPRNDTPLRYTELEKGQAALSDSESGDGQIADLDDSDPQTDALKKALSKAIGKPVTKLSWYQSEADYLAAA